MTKIGILIPTRGDRKEFLQFALKQIERQTLQPDMIEIVDDKPLSKDPDITYRYQIGCKRLEEKGCELIIPWEDDDWYSPIYIQLMYDKWIEAGKPDMIGIGRTLYYNIHVQKYVLLLHPSRASMMSTAFTTAINKIEWCEDNYSYTDMHLWTKTNLKKHVIPIIGNPPCVGIKHGVGLCGGGGHNKQWKIYNEQDHDFKFLSGIVGEDISFYREVVARSKYIFRSLYMSADNEPFLTVVTRIMQGKRNNLFKQHMKSVIKLKDTQLVHIIDQVGHGMLAANTSFQHVKSMIKGKYVYLLDDDDFVTNGNFVEELKNVTGDPDVIFFKMKILTGDGDEMYPKPTSWKSREPKRGQIGGSCFVVKKWVYETYIHHFAHSSFGDWNFITEVLKDKNVTCEWVDIKMAETGRVSRGTAEPVA